jgi:hypothetical protein
MDLTFLTGPVPLTKTIAYASRTGTYTTSPYPMVQKVTSHVRSVSNLHEFRTALIEEGRKGACLLKGGLDAVLTKESRAGHALDNGHPWVCFDFDGVGCVPGAAGAVAAVSKYLPEELRRSALLVQLSSSAFRPDTRTFSGHLFALLDRAVSTNELSEWLTWLNFRTPLREEIRLTESALGLHLPLDRTVASPAKLLYIAPPRCVGFDPGIKAEDAIYILPGSERTITFPTFTRVAKDEEDDLVNELRKAVELPKRSYATRAFGQHTIFVDSEPCSVSDIRSSGEGYIRFNLNGGDSLAYFIDLKNPALIGNFKGEPYLSTKEAAPDLYKALSRNQKALPRALPDCATEVMAFYATNRQSTIYIGTYDRARDTMRVDASNQTAALAWLVQYGIALKPTLPHFDLVTDMTSDIRFEEGYPVVNLYRQTDFLKTYASLPRSQPCDSTGVSRLESSAPLIAKILKSVLGTEKVDPSVYFLNWLSAIFQRRQRMMTAWVMAGVQGTGKGLLVDHIIRPLFGEELVTQQNYAILKSNHNSYLEGKLFVVFNEADMRATENWAETRMKLYDWITEPRVSINPKGKDEREVPNHANFLFMSNKTQPVVIEDNDRRFNVGEHQTARLYVTPNEIASLINQDQLKALAEVLGSWQVNDEMLIKPYGGDAKEAIYEATHNLLDRIARAIKEGDTQYFIDNQPDPIQLRTDFSGRVLPMAEYSALLENIVKGLVNVLTPNDLYVLFRMVAISDKSFPETRAVQRQIYQRYGFLPEKDVTFNDNRTGATVRGIAAPRWQINEAIEAQVLRKPDSTNVVSMR